MSAVTGTEPPPRPVLGSFRGVDDLRLVGRQVYYEQLGFWLNPIAAAFTVGFSVVFLVLLSSTAGSSRIADLNNMRLVVYYVASFAAYGIMSACFSNLSISLVVRREMGLLKRVRLSPLPTWVMLGAIFVNALIISVLQVVILFLIGRFGFHVGLPHNLLALVVALVAGVICFTALGIAVSTVIPNQEAAGPLVSIVFFILLFLSGLYYPIKSGSLLARVSAVFPVRHMITATDAPYFATAGVRVSPWAWHDIQVLAIWAVVGIVVSLRRWSWAPRRSDPGRSLRSPFARRG
ncbi:MAG TPA: ABC transporter permease [Acidimicrobiales bacterium]